MVFCTGRGDKGIDFGEGVRGDNVDGLELLGEGRGVGGSVQDVRIGVFGGRGKAPCKAGEDHDKEHETYQSGISIKGSSSGQWVTMQCLGAGARQGSRDRLQRISP